MQQRRQQHQRWRWATANWNSLRIDRLEMQTFAKIVHTHTHARRTPFFRICWVIKWIVGHLKYATAINNIFLIISVGSLWPLSPATWLDRPQMDALNFFRRRISYILLTSLSFPVSLTSRSLARSLTIARLSRWLCSKVLCGVINVATINCSRSLWTKPKIASEQLHQFNEYTRQSFTFLSILFIGESSLFVPSSSRSFSSLFSVRFAVNRRRNNDDCARTSANPEKTTKWMDSGRQKNVLSHAIN